MATSKSSSTLRKGVLTIGGTALVTGVHANLTLDEQIVPGGVFLHARTGTPAARWIVPIGTVTSVTRYTATHRYEPFWMKPCAGTDLATVPVETQWLLCEREDGQVALVVPLIDGAFRATVQGKDGALAVVVESGDPYTLSQDVLALYVAVGPDAYALLESAAVTVCERLKTGRLRRDKLLPSFSDVFGWCTWDAFYQEVSTDKVELGLSSFAKGGVQPRMMILDDGWQSERTMPTGERRLTGFAANGKFPGDLSATVRMAKSEYGIETFLVWHAVHGYWAGVDGAALPGYGVRDVPRSYGPGILSHQPNFNLDWWGALVGLVPAESIHRFYHDYHRHLRAQGVDGVKVDNQASIEGLGVATGGRVALMQAYREALESSVGRNFDGNLINCMSCANEMFYLAYGSNLTRTSTDFWPNIPSSHGLHLYTNAQVGAWFGEFCWPDWDMFQSGHAMGAFHAAGRAVSGAPVYVSDKPGVHDFALLKKLVLSDGSVARAKLPGRPTRDCLFRDPTREDVLLKIFSRNQGSGVVGAFNSHHHADPKARRAVSGDISPSDVHGLEGLEFVIYAHNAQSVALAKRSQRLPIALDELTAEVYTIVPIEEGVAPIGLTGLFNSGGSVLESAWVDGAFSVLLSDGGEFACWSTRKPSKATVNGKDSRFAWEAVSGVRVTLTRPGQQRVVLSFAARGA